VSKAEPREKLKKNLTRKKRAKNPSWVYAQIEKCLCCARPSYGKVFCKDCGGVVRCVRCHARLMKFFGRKYKG
jgi:hypothetical protein